MAATGSVVPFLVELVDQAVLVFGAGGATAAGGVRGELVVAFAGGDEAGAGGGEDDEHVLWVWVRGLVWELYGKKAHRGELMSLVGKAVGVAEVWKCFDGLMGGLSETYLDKADHTRPHAVIRQLLPAALVHDRPLICNAAD